MMAGIEHDLTDHYRAVFDAMDEGACIIERVPDRPDGRCDYRYLAMNRSMQAMFGIPDLTGQSIRDNFPDESEVWYDDYDRVLATGQPVRVERESVPQGMVLTMFLSRLNEKPGQLLAIMRDVTARRKSEEHFRKAQEKLALALDATQIGTFDYNLITGELVWDDRCRVLFGLPPDAQVNYETFLAGLHPDDLRATDQAVSEAIDPTGTGDYDVEYRTVGRIDGQVRWVAAKGKTFFADGRAVRFIGTVRDITSAYKSQRRLIETEERYRLASRATNDAIWDWDFNTNYVRWNEALEDAYGHKPSDFQPTGEWWIEHIHPDDRARVDQSIHSVIESSQIEWTDQYRFRRADGSYADIFDRGHVIRDENGNPSRMIGAMLDLTRVQRAESALRESQRELLVERGLLQAVVQQAPIGISIAYADGRENINTRLQEMLGPQHDIEPLLARLGLTIMDASGQLVSFSKDGDPTPRRFEVSSTPVRDDAGNAIASVAIVADVEERVQAEEHRALLNNELSHRLKNTFALVNSVISQTLRTAPDLATVQKALSERISTLARAHDIVVTGKQDTASVRELVRAATSIHSERERIHFSGPEIDLDPKAALSLSLIIHELCTNAIKYGSLSNPDGQVSVVWSVLARAESDGEELFQFTWEERNGPPVKPPARKSFGTRLIQVGFGGDDDVSLEYHVEGLWYRVRTPLALLQTKGGYEYAG